MWTPWTPPPLAVFVWLAGFLAAPSLAADDPDYFNNYCTLCADHTLCQYSKGPGWRCRNFFSRDLGADERQAALHAHNALRNRVAAGEESRGHAGRSQPAAANMHRLRWDEELAAAATRWASQCVFDQDTCRTSLDGTSVGQNIYMQMAAPGSVQPPFVSVARAVQKWSEEAAAHDGHLATQPYVYSQTTWHYTNMVWARTTRLGCGYADYSAASGAPTRLIVCNYKEAGNVVGSPVYAAGRPLSQCPGGATPPPVMFPPQPPVMFPPQQPVMFPPQQPVMFPPQQPVMFPPQPPAMFPPQQPVMFPPQQPVMFPPQQPMTFPPQQPVMYPPQPPLSSPPPWDPDPSYWNPEPDPAVWWPADGSQVDRRSLLKTARRGPPPARPRQRVQGEPSSEAAPDLAAGDMVEPELEHYPALCL